MVERKHKTAVWISWKYAAGEEAGRGLPRRLREGRRQGRQGTLGALPQRRVPGAADRDREHQAGRGGLLLRRRRRGQVHQGLRGRRPQGQDSALRLGLPHRRRARRASRTSAQGIITTLHYADSLPIKRDEEFRRDYAKAYKLQPDVYAVQGYDAGQLLATGAEGGQGRRRQQEGHDQGDGRRDRSTARAASGRCPRRTTRFRTCTCARWSASRTRYVAWRSKQLADPARGCRM